MMRHSPSQPRTAGPHWPAHRAPAARPAHVARARRISVPAVSLSLSGRRLPLRPNALDAAA